MKYILLLGLIVGIWACDDFLTVRPKSDTTEDDYLRLRKEWKMRCTGYMPGWDIPICMDKI